MSAGDPISSVYRWLQGAGLERFYPNFSHRGITEESFVNLIVSDYHSLGVTELNDRQTLFKLIQVVKKEMESPTLKLRQSPAPQREGGSFDKISERQENQHSNRQTSKSTPTLDAFSDSTPRATKTRSRRRNSPGDTKERKLFKKTSSSSTDHMRAQPRITVCVRKRPLNSKERGKGEGDCTSTKGNQTFIVTEPRTKVDLTKFTCAHKFYFDTVFDQDTSNEQIYNMTCKPLVDFFFEGGKATCFAYGQTGSGKTYTMMGPEGGKKEQNGLYVLAARDIFQELQRRRDLEIHVSFFEIYGGKFYDLLNGRRRLELREDAHGAVHTIGLKEISCQSRDQLIEMIQFGNERRSQGATGVNMSSSRSHAILQIASKKRSNGKLHGKYSFIDLAGSERAADTQGNAAKTRIEGAEINKSLLALKECIRALDQNASHRPFRGSKLTQVLKESLVGNSKTVMIATVSPCVSSVEHTLNTLRYADRVKEMKEAGGGRSSSRHKAYMPHHEEIRKLRSKSPTRSTRTMSMVAGMHGGGGGGGGGSHCLKPPTRRANTTLPPSSSSSSSSLSSSSLKSPAVNNHRLKRASSASSPSPHHRHHHYRSQTLKSPTNITAIRSTSKGRYTSSSSSSSSKASFKYSSSSSHHSSSAKASGIPRSSPSLVSGGSGLEVEDLDIEAEVLRGVEGGGGSTHEGVRGVEETGGGGGGQQEVASKMEQLSQQSRELAERNRQAEGAILDQHRKHIHSTMQRVKQEMEILKKFEGKSISVNEYVDQLRDILGQKEREANDLSCILNEFEANLQEADFLSLRMDEMSLGT